MVGVAALFVPILVAAVFVFIVSSVIHLVLKWHMSDYRVERDTMGELEVPDGAYYGASTMRAVKNFPASGLKPPSRFVRALGLIKLAAAKVNADLGLLDPKLADAIVAAAAEIVEGKHDDLSEQAFYMCGGIEEAIENASKMKN